MRLLNFIRPNDPICSDCLALLISNGIGKTVTVEITPDDILVDGDNITLLDQVGIQFIISGYEYVDRVTQTVEIADIPNLQTSLNSKAPVNHTHDYAPTDHTHNYAPTSHTHAQADITNLTSDLAGKANTSHSHVTYAALANGATAMAFGTNTTVKVTPTANATYTTTVPVAGTEVALIILTSGTTSRTITFGTGFKAVGTLATGTVSARVFVIKFVSDGVNLYESSRTAAIVA